MSTGLGNFFGTHARRGDRRRIGWKRQKGGLGKRTRFEGATRGPVGVPYSAQQIFGPAAVVIERWKGTLER